ncbi:MAG: serine/threonine protein kinase [Phycisphaeraceae bacterium]|nr:MAG: serine/threonine protein kinase [Phycisphaeraceae bacterium]
MSPDEPTHDPSLGPDGGRGTGIDPATERLFDLSGGSWVERLRASHERVGLGRLGAFELIEEIGRGGQGEVYRAVQPGTGRVVAIKRVAGLGFSPSAAMLARFTREVEALTRLSHPNVVGVHALEVIDGHSLLVMEYVSGRPIDRWADEAWGAGGERRAVMGDVLGCFAGVCEGVSHAHRRGVLHRDIKPANILVTAEGEPKILDFGIARLLNEQAVSGAGAAWTVTGFAGTPAYASPEQLRPTPEGIDTRSDVYSLGVLLYRVLTGREAYETGRGIADLMRQMDEGCVVPPTRARAGLPAECDWIVRKAMEPDPGRRYQSVDALAEDVKRLIEGRAVLAHPPSAWYTLRRAVTRRPWISAGVAVSVAAIGTLGAVAVVQAARLTVRTKDLEAALAESDLQRVRAIREEARQALFNRLLIEASAGMARDDYFVNSTDSNVIETFRRLIEKLPPGDESETALELNMRLGFALRDAARHNEAIAYLGRAFEISERIDDPMSERRCRLAGRLSYVHRAAGENEMSLRVIDRAIAAITPESRTLYTAVLWHDRMHTLTSMGGPIAEVLESARLFLETCDRFPERVSERARGREEAALSMYLLGEFSRCEAACREGLMIGANGALGGQTISRLRFRLAEALIRQGRWEEAEPEIRAASEYRVRLESARGNRAAQYTRLHAETLHRLGRHAEAVPKWELSLVKALENGNPADRTLAVLRLRLAAARLAAGQETPGMIDLARALSRGSHTDPGHPEIAALCGAVREALRVSGWRIGDEVRAALGRLAWMADFDPLTRVPGPRTPGGGPGDEG